VLLVEHDLGELAPVIGSDDRGRGVGACGNEVLGCQARRADRQHADALAGRQDALDERICIRLGRRDGHATWHRDLATGRATGKPARRGDPVGAQLHQLRRRVEKALITRPIVAHDPVGVAPGTTL